MNQDTDPREVSRYVSHLWRLAPVDRLRAAFARTAGVRALALAGIRARYPSASDDELRVRLATRIYGRAVAQRLYGSIPDDAI